MCQSIQFSRMTNVLCVVVRAFGTVVAVATKMLHLMKAPKWNETSCKCLQLKLNTTYSECHNLKFRTSFLIQLCPWFLFECWSKTSLEECATEFQVLLSNRGSQVANVHIDPFQHSLKWIGADDAKDMRSSINKNWMNNRKNYSKRIMISSIQDYRVWSLKETNL